MVTGMGMVPEQEQHRGLQQRADPRSLRGSPSTAGQMPCDVPGRIQPQIKGGWEEPGAAHMEDM